MKHLALADVTARLPALIDDVVGGEEITILRDGQPVARIVAAQEKPTLAPEYSPEEIERRREAVQRIRASAREMNSNVTYDEIRNWIEEGRG